MQAAPDQFKFSLVTSVLVHVRVGALPIVLLSESLYKGLQFSIPSQKLSGLVTLINH